ncbi:hypothetical protein MMC10_011042 [Thelotrema lepadinum]|nr:hypothetical protein [Thelotrema lepadinum]
MVERSSSHKSEGRQSSTGHSAHSTRLNSLAFDPRSPALDNPGSIGPPPGLLLLGPLPSIIRCWLDENFSNDALLYAAVCTGSCTSMISSRLAHRFGIVKQRSDRERGKVTLQVYLPEATVQHASSRPLNLIPQVPSISIDFEVFDLSDDVNALQVIIGSDILRSKSAELSFSQDKMMIFDDERNKLAIPLVRPENSSSFQTLRTTPTSTLQISLEHPSQGISGFSSLDSTTKTLEQSEARSGPLSATKSHPGEQDNNMSASEKATRSSLPSTTESGRIVTRDGLVSSDSPGIQHHDDNQTKEPSNGASLGTPAKEGQTGMWGSWRRDANQPIPSDSTFSSVASGSSYQRPGRGKGMKVLKPARSGTSRSVSTTPNSSNPEQMLPRSQDPPIRTVNSTAVESPESKTPDSPQRSFSGEPRASFSSVSGGKPRTANPVGGASAFGWLNSAQK